MSHISDTVLIYEGTDRKGWLGKVNDAIREIGRGQEFLPIDTDAAGGFKSFTTPMAFAAFNYLLPQDVSAKIAEAGIRGVRVFGSTECYPWREFSTPPPTDEWGLYS